MVDMEAPKEEHSRPVNLGFADDWQITPILTHEEVR